MRDVVKFSLFSKFDQNTTVKRDNIQEIRVLIRDRFQSLVTLLKLLLREKLLSLDHFEIGRFLLDEQFDNTDILLVFLRHLWGSQHLVVIGVEHIVGPNGRNALVVLNP